MDGFPSNLRQDVLVIFQDIAPKFSGNTAFNGIMERPIQGGFEIVLIESITPYGVKLDIASGGWANKRDRRTGNLLEGWFSTNGKNAGMEYLRGVGGYANNMNATRERVAREAIDNPLRQRIYAQYIAERGDSDVNIT